ncbi:MAG TPA: flagellar motor protein MotA, partial [Rhodospirillales bacterium]|nr:flagellar motor protein MotA [Rhodospirillales bacterium]
MANGGTRAAKSKSGVDLATIIGLISGFGLIIAAIFLGGDPLSFVNPPSILIVIGGTFAITSMCFSVKEMANTSTVIGKTFFYSAKDPADAAVQVLQVAELARRQGVLSLQNILPPLKSDPFLYKGMAMVVDGTPGEEVELILRRDLSATQ